jgi:hypothetical protein
VNPAHPCADGRYAFVEEPDLADDRAVTHRFAPICPIKVVAHPMTGVPIQLYWHGQAEQVDEVEESWVVDEGCRRGPEAIRHRYFQLFTQSGFYCTIYWDLSNRRWYLARIID